MTNLRDRVNIRRELLVSRSNSCIPGILSDTPFEYAKSFFNQSISNSINIDKITIIDPYISAMDLDHITSLFGGNGKISLEVISKFDSFGDQNEKSDRKKLIMQKKEFCTSNGLFKDIELIHSKLSMHDRYYIYWNGDIMEKVFFIGGSIGQVFSNYIAIMEVSDRFMLNNISTYRCKLITNKINFSKV